MSRLVAALVVLVWSASAAADRTPFKETLTRNELAAAVKAVEDKLVVDKDAAAKCFALPREQIADQAIAAACFRGSGNLGLAITLWKAVVADSSAARSDREEATRQLGPAYEAAAIYPEAAKWHSEYFARFNAADARERLIRAVCIWRQLGDVSAADRGFKQLGAMRRQPKPRSATLCATVTPIVVPPSPSP